MCSYQLSIYTISGVSCAIVNGDAIKPNAFKKPDMIIGEGVTCTNPSMMEITSNNDAWGFFGRLLKIAAVRGARIQEYGILMLGMVKPPVKPDEPWWMKTNIRSKVCTGFMPVLCEAACDRV